MRRLGHARRMISTQFRTILATLLVGAATLTATPAASQAASRQTPDLKARSANAGFLGGLTSANVKSGGAKIDTNTYDITIAQPLLDGSGGGGLTKSNTGKLTLSGTNTYTGATAITGGTLALTGSGSIASSSSIAIAGATSTFDVSGIAAGTWTVGASQTVSGIGTLNGGSKILSVAGTLAPGNSAGDLGINLSPGGTLDLASGSVLAFELGSTSDSLTFSSVGNWLTGSGNATLSLTMLDGFSYAGTYTIFDNVTTTGFTLADISGYDETNYSANFLQSGDSYNLTFTAVPEPRAALIGGLGLIALLRRSTRTATVVATADPRLRTPAPEPFPAVAPGAQGAAG